MMCVKWEFAEFSLIILHMLFMYFHYHIACVIAGFCRTNIVNQQA